MRVVNFGTGTGWADGLDYAATTLKTMANEQRRMSGAELTVRAYRRVRTLPQPVATALRAPESDSTILAARYKPVAVRPRVRPREKSAT